MPDEIGLLEQSIHSLIPVSCCNSCHRRGDERLRFQNQQADGLCAYL
jgi:hypothetical protein